MNVTKIDKYFIAVQVLSSILVCQNKRRWLRSSFNLCLVEVSKSTTQVEETDNFYSISRKATEQLNGPVNVHVGHRGSSWTFSTNVFNPTSHKENNWQNRIVLQLFIKNILNANIINLFLLSTGLYFAHILTLFVILL